MIKSSSILFVFILAFSYRLFAQESFTLTQLLDSALQDNYMLQANETQRRIKQYEIEVLKTNYQPQISTSASISYWKFLLPNKERLLGASLTDVYNDISVYQTVYDWGQNRVKKKIVEDEVLINDELRKQIAATIIWGVSDAYFEALKAQSKIAVHLSAIEQLNSQLQYAENLYNIGRISGLDVLKIKVEISVEEKNLQISQSDLQDRLIRLKRLSNLHENSEIQVFDCSDSLFQAYQDMTFISDELFSEAFHHHPALTTFNLEMKLESKEKDVLRLENRPEFFGYALATWEDSSIPFSNNFNYNFGLGLRYTLPYLGGGGYKVKMLQNDLRVSQMEEEKKQAFLDIKKEIETTLNEIDQGKSEIRQNEKIIYLAEEALKNAWALYQSGQGNIIDVLDAQSVLTEAAIHRGQSVSAYLQSLAKLNYFIGSDDYPF